MVISSIKVATGLHNLLGRLDLDGRVVLDAVDAVIGIQVFVQGDLEEGCASLPGELGH
jgi:hypothetical protein